MKKNGYETITTWVDCFSKGVSFFKHMTSDTSIGVAYAILADLSKHHGMQDGIVSDRDYEFTSDFGKRSMQLCGIMLKILFCRKRQTERSSEIMNEMGENYL